MTVPTGTTRTLIVYAYQPITVAVPELDENEARKAVKAWLNGGTKPATWVVKNRAEGGYTTHVDIKIHVPGEAS